jgi:hypothetical protein
VTHIIFIRPLILILALSQLVHLPCHSNFSYEKQCVIVFWPPGQ